MNAFAILATAVLAAPAPPPQTAIGTATVALVVDLPDATARAAVMRRAAPRVDIILLAQAHASIEDLAAALSVLAEARERDGPSTLQRDEMLVVKSSRLAAPLDARQRLRLDGHLARLRAARPRPVEGVGTVPAIEVIVRAGPRAR
jgi:hypothetical protein